jgi:hypothetical protein
MAAPPASTFRGRLGLTHRLDRALRPLLTDAGLICEPLGQPPALANMPETRKRLTAVAAKASPAVRMVRFTPDFLIIRPGHPDGPLLADTKVSVTPLFHDRQVSRIRRHAGRPEIGREDIAEIEREAWYTYNRCFPPNRVALIVAAPYHPRCVVAEWVLRVRCLWCYAGRGPDGPRPFPCQHCPVFSRRDEGFGVLGNFFTSGSGTPHTNIDLGSCRPLDRFLADTLGVTPDPDRMAALIAEVRSWPIQRPARISAGHYERVLASIRRNAPWVRGPGPTPPNGVSGR